MIFATDADGKATFVSPDWTAYTGQTLAEAVDFGWVRVVHPEDLETVRGIVADAIRDRSQFSVRYRLRCRDGLFIWVAAGAVPSFGPPGRTFLGFLGSITRIADAGAEDLTACGSLGSFAPAPPDPAARPASDLELAADHLLMAHALLARTGTVGTLGLVEAALHQVGIALARAESLPDANRLH